MAHGSSGGAEGAKRWAKTSHLSLKPRVNSSGVIWPVVVAFTFQVQKAHGPLSFTRLPQCSKKPVP